MRDEFRRHELDWLLEPLRSEASYLEKPMFGCLGVYMYGNLVLVLASKSDKLWNGVLVPTFREHHSALIADFPSLTQHTQLGKWLYQAEDTEEFEEIASALVDLILEKDPRIGVPPART